MKTAKAPATLSVPQNISLTLVGQSIPILIGLITVPGLIHNLGAERFGALAIAWILIGYFSLFDLGLGRAVTLKLSQLIASNSSEIKTTFLTSSLFSILLGIIGGSILFFLAPWLAQHYLNTSDELRIEVQQSLKWMALALPFLISSVVFRGTLEAFGDFKTINKIMVPMGSLTYGLPYLVSTQTQSLVPLIWTLVAIRFFMWLLFCTFSLKRTLQQSGLWSTKWQVLKGLLFFGFWITSVNIINPIISYIDRMLIGSLISLEAIAHYMVPMEIVQKLWLIPTALGAVLFPAFSSLHHLKENPERLMSRALKTSLVLLFPFGLILASFSHEILSVWIGKTFATEAGQTLRILGMGIWINCLGAIPLAYIQASGRPDIPAKLYFIEFPIYLLLLITLIPTLGIEGAALAWVLRVTMDTSVLTALALGRLGSLRFWCQILGAIGVFSLMLLVNSLLPLGYRVPIVLVTLILFLSFVWHFIVLPEERFEAIARLSSWLMRKTQSPTELPPMSVKKIGIALAAYKPNPHFFRAQLSSIQSQTFQNWCCVITCDSSLGEIFSWPDIRKFADDPRFKFIENTYQLGVKANFEKALEIVAREEVDAIAFCDQDDVWYPNKLLVLAQELEKKPRLSLVHCDMKLLFEDQSKTLFSGQSTWTAEGRQVDFQTTYHYLIRNCVSGSGSLFDAELARQFGRFPDEIDFHDHWITLVASINGGVYPVHQPLYEYRQHSENIVGVALRSEEHLPKFRWKHLFEHLRKAHRSWLLTQNLLFALEREGIVKASPRLIFSSFNIGVYLIVLSLLSRRDDQVLSISAFVKGVGAIVHSTRIFGWNRKAVNFKKVPSAH